MRLERLILSFKEEVSQAGSINKVGDLQFLSGFVINFPPKLLVLLFSFTAASICGNS